MKRYNIYLAAGVVTTLSYLTILCSLLVANIHPILAPLFATTGFAVFVCCAWALNPYRLFSRHVSALDFVDLNHVQNLQVDESYARALASGSIDDHTDLWNLSTTV